MKFNYRPRFFLSFFFFRFDPRAKPADGTDQNRCNAILSSVRGATLFKKNLEHSLAFSNIILIKYRVVMKYLR